MHHCLRFEAMSWRAPSFESCSFVSQDEAGGAASPVVPESPVFTAPRRPATQRASSNAEDLVAQLGRLSRFPSQPNRAEEAQEAAKDEDLPALEDDSDLA